MIPWSRSWFLIEIIFSPWAWMVFFLSLLCKITKEIDLVVHNEAIAAEQKQWNYENGENTLTN